MNTHMFLWRNKKISLFLKIKKRHFFNPCHAELIKLPRPLQSDYLIEVVDTNSHT